MCKAYVPPDFSLGLIGLSLSTLFVMNEVLLLGWLMLVAMLVVLIRVQGRSLAERAAVRRQAGRDESWFRQVELGRCGEALPLLDVWRRGAAGLR